MLGIVGPVATLVAAPRLPKKRFTLDKCTDPDRLSELSERHRNPELLQPERSTNYLKWAYGSLLASQPGEESMAIFTFTDNAGLDGWFALGFQVRGGLDQIQSARLLDVVWPRSEASFTEVMPAIIEAARSRADLLSMKGRVGLGLHDGDVGVRRRALLAPEGFILGKLAATAELVERADFPFVDRY